MAVPGFGQSLALSAENGCPWLCLAENGCPWLWPVPGFGLLAENGCPWLSPQKMAVPGFGPGFAGFSCPWLCLLALLALTGRKWLSLALLTLALLTGFGWAENGCPWLWSLASTTLLLPSLQGLILRVAQPTRGQSGLRVPHLYGRVHGPSTLQSVRAGA